MLEAELALSAGEANVASSEVTKEGDLRISFHRGSFASAVALQRAVHSAAEVVNDVQGDVINSFQRLTPHPGLKSAEEMQIFLEGVDDNPDFARLVAQELVRNNPYLQGRCRPVPSLQNMSDQERDKYLSGEDLTWDKGKKVRILARIAESGHKIGAMDPDKAFDGVKLVNVSAGEVLIEAGSPPGFVYVALTEGLHGTPLGGYRPFPVYPYTPLGNTGVIRGAARNATIVAERPLSVLMIPKEIYLKEWHDTYSAHEFKELLIQVYREQ